VKSIDQVLLEEVYERISMPQKQLPQQTSKVKTFGDLLKLIQGIQIKNKGGQLLDKSISFAVDQAIGLIPGASNAKTAFDFLKTAFMRPDTKKTGTVVDKLNVDDQVAAIVDSSVEHKFLVHLIDIIKQHGVNTPIPSDWNITKELQVFLQKNFNNRTVEIPQN
jgi:hypothetical protein